MKPLTRIFRNKALLGRSLSHMTRRYDSLVQNGGIINDPVQLKTVKLLDKLRGVIESFDFSSFQQPTPISNVPNDVNNANESYVPRLRGMYIYGSVGTGKTMLMDLLFQECHIEKKRKVHFHQFMLEVHRRIHQHKQFLLQKYGRQRHINLSEDQDSIRYIAKEIAKEANLLCFDEFQVTDICDAVIMTKLFDTLWAQGVVLVATSNRPPDDLYLNGMNRPDFLPFIDRLKRECIVRELDSGKDYRVLRHSGNNSSTSFASIQQMQYLHPLSEVNRDKFFWNYGQELQSLKEESISIRSVHTKKTSDGKIEVSIPNTNRFLVLDQAEPGYGIGLVDFKILCETDRGASDYHALASTFHTLYLSNIPRLTKENHNSARRFITLVDELYNANARLVCLAEAPPHELFWDMGTVSVEEDDISITEKANDFEDMKKYTRNHSPARITLSSTKSAESNIGEKYGDMGQQEEISVVESELASIQELSFAFQRATSRLLEMNSAHYYQVWQSRYMR